MSLREVRWGGVLPALVSSRTWGRAVQLLGSGRQSLRIATIIVTIAGGSWLVLEYLLRGDSGWITHDPTLTLSLAAICTLLGLATRARVSLTGERTVLTQLTSTVLFVTFLPPAVMLLVYGVAMLASATFVSFAWLLWIVSCAVAIAFQIAVLAGVLAPTLLYAKIKWGALVLAVLYVVTVGAIAKSLTGTFAAAWDFAVFRWAIERREVIPPWMFVVSALRSVYAGIAHEHLMRVQLSIFAGAVLGLGAALVTRLVRQRLMTNLVWRPYLPMGSAPLPDDVPLIHPRMFVPVVTYLLLGWVVILAWRIV